MWTCRQAMALATEFQRDGVGEREAGSVYREFAAHFLLANVHQSHPDRLPEDLDWVYARSLVELRMACGCRKLGGVVRVATGTIG